MKVVIMAGGKGTRIASVVSDIPKPMIPVEGRPVLEHQISCLRDQGFDDMILIVGHLGDVIRDYFQDGSRFGVNIDYFHEKEPLGTAGALFYYKHALKEDFLLLNGDIMIDVDFGRFIKFHQEKNALASLFTHPNSHPYDSALIETDKEGRVVRWIHKEETRDIYKNRVNAGIHILSPQLLSGFTEPKKTDLDRDLLKPLVSSGRLFAYDSPEYVKDMGTPDRYHLVCEDYRTGRIHEKNLLNRQKAVFLDRDGTINQYRGFITRPEELELIEGAAEAVRKINSSGYLAVVVSNQPVIARGDCTERELQRIHEKMETELGKQGAYIDALYYCPHHPDRGFEGERTEYKIACNCRKPKPGMLLQAARDYNIDLAQSYMVGDSYRDVEAGLAAGCKAVYIGETDSAHSCIRQAVCYGSLLEFANDKMGR